MTTLLAPALIKDTDLDLCLTSMGAFCTSLVHTNGEEESLIVYTHQGNVWVVLQEDSDITVIEKIAGDNVISLYDYKGTLLDYYMADMGYVLEVIQNF